MSEPANTPSGADIICASAAADIFDLHLCTGEQLGRVAQLFADHWARAQKEIAAPKYLEPHGSLS